MIRMTLFYGSSNEGATSCYGVDTCAHDGDCDNPLHHDLAIMMLFNELEVPVVQLLVKAGQN